jgi:hypothetical protein
LMIRDPFKTPQRLNPARVRGFHPRDLDDAAARIFPGYPPETHVVLATPADWACNVEGSEPVGKCGKCGTAVWLAPSSLTTRPWPLIACIRCLIQALPDGHPLKTGWRNAPPGEVGS